MKPIVSLAFALFTLSLYGQDCTKEILREKPGTWKAGQQGSMNNVSTMDLPKEKAVLAGIHKMIASRHTPKGCEISFSYTFGKDLGAGQNWIADPYHYSLYILRYLCENSAKDKSKYYVDYSTPTTVTITANVIYYLNNLYAANLPSDDLRGYLRLKQMPQKKEGAWFMGEEVVGDYGTSSEIREYRWLITYNDTLPFTYVSRKEYLMIQKKRLEQDLKDSPGEKEYISTFINNINAYLKKPDSELNKPAICPWNEEQRFENFVDEGTRNSFVAVKPNLAYYRKKLAKSSPQFFTVVFKVSKGDPVFTGNVEGIKNAIDFAQLKRMLGK